MMACLITAFIETPILFCVSNLLNGPEHWSPYMVVMFVAALQFTAVTFYFCVRGMSPFEIPETGLKLLLLRSLCYCLAINGFFYSLERLNPPCALMALHSGIAAITCLIRFWMREQLFFTMTIIKVFQVALFLELCLIPGLSTVKTDKFDKDYSMPDYWFDLAVGIGSGIILGIVSRMTSALSGGGKLLHES